MPRVKTDHTLPSFVALPVVDRAQLGRFQAGLGAARALLPQHPARPLRSDHAGRHARLQVIDRLLQDPEIAAHIGVPTDQPRASQAAVKCLSRSTPEPMQATAERPSARIGL